MTFDDAHEGLVIVDDVLAHVGHRQVAGVQRGAEGGECLFDVVDDDPDPVALEALDLADHERLAGDPGELLIAGLAAERDIDDLSVERRSAQVVRRVEQQQFTVAQQPDEIALTGLADVLGGDHERLAVLGHAPEPLPELAAKDGIDPCRRLVEEHECRVLDEGGGERQPALHPAGRVGDPCRALITQLDPVEQLVDARPPP